MLMQVIIGVLFALLVFEVIRRSPEFRHIALLIIQLIKLLPGEMEKVLSRWASDLNEMSGREEMLKKIAESDQDIKRTYVGIDPAIQDVGRYVTYKQDERDISSVPQPSEEEDLRSQLWERSVQEYFDRLIVIDDPISNWNPSPEKLAEMDRWAKRLDEVKVRSTPWTYDDFAARYLEEDEDDESNPPPPLQNGGGYEFWK